MTQCIQQAPEARIDYVAVVHPDSLEAVEVIQGQVLIALAVHVGPTRLIDNMVVTIKGSA